MPPKKKVNKKKDGKDKEKKAVMVDGLPADQMNPEQLLDYIERLREEVDREREERNLIQLERDKVNMFWEISKQQLDVSSGTSIDLFTHSGLYRLSNRIQKVIFELKNVRSKMERSAIEWKLKSTSRK